MFNGAARLLSAAGESLVLGLLALESDSSERPLFLWTLPMGGEREGKSGVNWNGGRQSKGA